MIKTVIYLSFLSLATSFPDRGQWSASFTKVSFAIFGTHKSLYAGSSIYVSVVCEPKSATDHTIELQWVIRQASCYEDYLASDVVNPQVLQTYFSCPMSTNYFPEIRYFTSEPIKILCSNRINLEFVNATFTTFSDKVPIPPGCEVLNALPSESSSQVLNNGEIGIQASTIPSSQKLNHIRRKRAVASNSLKSTNSTVASASSATSGATSNFEKNKMVSSNSVTTERRSETHKVKDEKSISSQNSAKAFSNQSSLMYTSGSVLANDVKLGSKLATVDMDGVYLFIIRIKGIKDENFSATIDVGMKGQHGFLSAVDYPLLIFYALMCGVYVAFAIAWLVVSALQWRDLLRIQFWIGGVILLGLMEKAVFYAEYQSINYTGQSVQGAILFAEILSCMKRTLARMLIIIVSLGFGIVKPRLGPMLHRVVGVGVLYFILGTIEGCLRVLKPKTDPGNQVLMAGIPLAVTDSAICWWIFSSLVQTIRTLRLRRNIVKLQLYRHFTNLLLLSVISSIAFMIWSVHNHKLVNCLSGWKELWVDEAYWHFLFSLVLAVIMVLWRPTNNNQRYAFTPLLDSVDEEDEDTIMNNDSFDGMKIRLSKTNSNASTKEEELKVKQDEDLKWVEENIPSTLSEAALPSLMDSDEEIMTAKFERNKME